MKSLSRTVIDYVLGKNIDINALPDEPYSSETAIKAINIGLRITMRDKNYPKSDLYQSRFQSVADYKNSLIKENTNKAEPSLPASSELAAVFQRVLSKNGICDQTDHDLFFDGNKRGPKQRQAKDLCQICPMRTACAEYAIIFEEMYGVWGGLNPDERTKIRQEIKQAPSSVNFRALPFLWTPTTPNAKNSGPYWMTYWQLITDSRSRKAAPMNRCYNILSPSGKI